MTSFTFSLLFSLALLLSSTCQAAASTELIDMLSRDISQSESDEEKSMLHIYRARQYFKLKEWEKTEEDYTRAVELNPKGWMHLERSHFYMSRKQYDHAYRDARAAKKAVPTLSREADKVIESAGAEIIKQYEAENPITIVMDAKVDSKRKTRFDLKRTQRLAAAPARQQCSIKTRPKPQAKSSRKPTKRKG